MNRSAIQAMLASAVAIAASACASAPETPAEAATTPVRAVTGPATALTQRERWNLPTRPFRIAQNVYYVGTAGLGAFLFTSPQGHILLDGALPESVPQIEASIAALGFKVTDIKYILNSHAHYDHSGGLAKLKADSGAQMVAMEGDVSALEGGFYLGSESITAMGAPPVKVDRVVRDGDKVRIGDLVLVANLTPGHSRGCTSWSTTVQVNGAPKELVVFCSATVAANRLVGPPQYEGIVADYRATFDRVKTMKADIPLAPHPEIFRLLEKRDAQKSPDDAAPFIDPTALQTLIGELQQDFDKQLAAQSAAQSAKASQ
jgi:metallo-beta-lactamase class B